jgi:hypothetical protein
MNYTREQCDEARRRFVDGQPWEKIVEVFATVPQVTLEEAVQIRSEYYRRVGPEGIKTAQEIMQQVVNAVLAKRGTGIAAKPADGIITEDALSIALYALAREKVMVDALRDADVVLTVLLDDLGQRCSDERLTRDRISVLIGQYDAEEHQ